MKPKTHTAVLPAFLASALINGDTSGIADSPEDMQLLKEALAYCEGFAVVDVEGESYFGRSEASFSVSFRGEVADFVLMELP